MNLSGYQEYKKVQVQTADQGKLILMCYDGAINFLNQAKFHMLKEDISTQKIFLNKAQDILWELTSSLNLEAGELAYNLDALYNYMIRRIIDADHHNSSSAIDEVVGFLEELRKSWGKIIQKSD
ncbi:MAG: flagellar export chaperone FliS [Thermodesulfobacteriota bacterium]|nr:flagellar export chaperone FliS [Thermodesulfobacteriota bacterium]